MADEKEVTKTISVPLKTHMALSLISLKEKKQMGEVIDAMFEAYLNTLPEKTKQAYTLFIQMMDE